MSSVLVIGGLGAIGIWVTRKLVEHGERVVTFSRRPDTTRIKDILDKVNLVAGDTSDMPSIIHTIRHYGVERVINMASIIEQGETNPYMAFKLNVEGALNVLEACRLTDVRRIVYASSKGVYDLAWGEYAHPTYKPMDEDYPKAPRNIYGLNKLYLENMGLHYNRIYGLDFIAVRFGATWGPGRLSQSGALSHIDRIIDSAMHGTPLHIPQGGDQMDDFIYLKDCANGVALACLAENPEHRIFHLGTGKGDTLRHFTEIVNRIFGSSLEIGPGLDFVGYDKKEPIYSITYGVFDISRARKELGYNPQYNFETGVKDYIETLS